MEKTIVVSLAQQEDFLAVVQYGWTLSPTRRDQLMARFDDAVLIDALLRENAAVTEMAMLELSRRIQLRGELQLSPAVRVGYDCGVVTQYFMALARSDLASVALDVLAGAAASSTASMEVIVDALVAFVRTEHAARVLTILGPIITPEADKQYVTIDYQSYGYMILRLYAGTNLAERALEIMRNYPNRHGLADYLESLGSFRDCVTEQDLAMLRETGSKNFRLKNFWDEHPYSERAFVGFIGTALESQAFDLIRATLFDDSLQLDYRLGAIRALGKFDRCRLARAAFELIKQVLNFRIIPAAWYFHEAAYVALGEFGTSQFAQQALDELEVGLVSSNVDERQAAALSLAGFVGSTVEDSAFRRLTDLQSEEKLAETVVTAAAAFAKSPEHCRYAFELVRDLGGVVELGEFVGTPLEVEALNLLAAVVNSQDNRRRKQLAIKTLRMFSDGESAEAAFELLRLQSVRPNDLSPNELLEVSDAMAVFPGVMQRVEALRLNVAASRLFDTSIVARNRARRLLDVAGTTLNVSNTVDPCLPTGEPAPPDIQAAADED